jgi:hypothetical protein
MSIPEDEDIYSEKYEKEREALSVLFPSEKDFESRIKLITQLKGSSPNLQIAYLAYCEWKILDAMEKQQDIDWDSLDPVKFLMSYAPSLKGRHADRAVEIARAAQITTEKGILDRFLGRE